jgi:N-acetylglutamate synthase-like GNAT family acetyltransferase
MQNFINLRKAEIADKKNILEIISFLHLDIPGFVWGDDKFIEKQIQSGEYFLAENDNNPIGIVSFKQRGAKMYIETLAVDEKYRSKGVGAKLINFAKNYTKEKGLNYLCACSFCEYKAEGFYLDQGFSLLDESGKYNNHKYQRFETKLQ